MNRFPQEAPPSRLLFAILKMLFTEKEADLVARLPIWPFTAKEAARAWKLDPDSARIILDDLAELAVLHDMPQNGKTYYGLPPPWPDFSNSP